MNSSTGATSGTKEVGGAQPPRAAGRAGAGGVGVARTPLVLITESAATPPLGSVAVSVDIPEKIEPFAPSRESRYLLQDTARKLLPQHRVSHCFWHLQRGESSVGVAYSSAAERARYLRLAVCGSVWACPVCASRITEKRAEEVRAALIALNDRGGSAGFATLTVAHSHEDALETVLEGFLTAFRSLTSWRGYKTLREEFGVLGYVRVLEVTYGRNGWHVHVHVLYFFDRSHTQETLSQLEARLYPLWSKAASKQGLSMSRQHGLEIKLAYGTVEEYLSKFGRGPRWDISREMTKGHVKRGRSVAGLKHLTPWELLAAAEAGDRRCGSLFREFVGKFDGKAQLYWSPGLRADLLPAAAEVSDHDLAVSGEEDEKEVGAIPAPLWESVKRDKGRERVLRLVEQAKGAWAPVAEYLAEVEERFPPYVPRERLAVSPELRVELDAMHERQRERNRWRGPLVGG